MLGAILRQGGYDAMSFPGAGQPCYTVSGARCPGLLRVKTAGALSLAQK